MVPWHYSDGVMPTGTIPTNPPSSSTIAMSAHQPVHRLSQPPRLPVHLPFYRRAAHNRLNRPSVPPWPPVHMHTPLPSSTTVAILHYLPPDSCILFRNHFVVPWHYSDRRYFDGRNSDKSSIAFYNRHGRTSICPPPHTAAAAAACPPATPSPPSPTTTTAAHQCRHGRPFTCTRHRRRTRLPPSATTCHRQHYLSFNVFFT